MQSYPQSDRIFKWFCRNIFKNGIKSWHILQSFNFCKSGSETKKSQQIDQKHHVFDESMFWWLGYLFLRGCNKCIGTFTMTWSLFMRKDTSFKRVLHKLSAVKGKAIDFTSPRTSSGQASYPDEMVLIGTILSPSGVEKTQRGKPPGIECEGWMTSHMWPRVRV